MDDEVRVRISKVETGPERFELLLVAVDDERVRWRKAYHGIIFLSMDAQSLDLLETVPGDTQAKARLRLKREADVHPGKLLKTGFRKDAEPKPGKNIVPGDAHARTRS